MAYGKSSTSCAEVAATTKALEMKKTDGTTSGGGSEFKGGKKKGK